MRKEYKGLTQDEVALSRERHGSNSLEKLRGRGLFRRFLDNLSDPIIRILIIALAIEVLFTFGNCNLIEVLGIVAAILIATVVSTLSEYGSERAFERMKRGIEDVRVRVRRDGAVCEIPIDELVVGDIVLISAGEGVAADGVVLDGEITVDQSALNGENIEAHKQAGKPSGWELSDPHRLFRGSVACTGECTMRVERVGADTFYGMVARDVQSETRESPLKLRLSKLAGHISRLGYLAALAVGITYIISALFVEKTVAQGDTKAILTMLLHALTMMITVVVVAVPEGLPMMITVVLSANMKRMLKDNILVKKLVGIETAGSLNILFTDKTGTLTTGSLSVDRIITARDSFRRLEALKNEAAVFDSLVLSAYCNTDSEISEGEVIGGNSTDRAILEFFKAQKAPDADIISRTAFRSDNKYSSVTLDNGVYIKGAPEMLLPRCRYTLAPDGTVEAFNTATVAGKLRDATERGERVVAVVREGKADSLIFVALIVLKDKLRPDVKKAVRAITGAGIQIVMVTGDNPDTAASIAEECGFYRKGQGHILLGAETLREMSDTEVKRILPDVRVIARALPTDKTRLVRLAQELELVVGMTGDGINDAPSLKLSDVGFAMGSGTEIAKNAGDVVILDNSINSISKAILYGRTIFKSIRKFITFQLIMNLAACGITLLGQIFGIDSPITIIQMLWVNIIMDTLGGLAFAGEPPLDYYMKEKPKRRDEPILSRDTVTHIVLNGAFTLLLLAAFLRLECFYDLFRTEREHITAFYAVFIFAGIFNSFSARAERFFLFSHIGKNKPFILIMLFISAIQILIIYFGGSLFRSTPLYLSELLYAILTASSVLLFDLIRRVIKKLSR